MTQQTGAPDPVIGRVLDRRYRLESLVARGGMATVYRGSDLRLERTVAIKVMHPTFATDPGFVQRFEREARAAARLNSPHVVAVHDQGNDSGLIYLVMEYVPGRTVRDVLRSHGRLPAQQALAIMEPVLEALGAAHRAGYVHRDVKPENVLISEDGRVKVTDFGLARAIEGSDSQKTHGLLLGTVAYLSPEHVEHDRTDARSDVYGAGILLFELLTGQVPYSAAAPMQVAYKHVHEDVPAPSSVEPSVPAELDAVVARATRRRPDDRFADAPAFLAEVRRIRGNLPAGSAWQPAPHDTLVAHREAPAVLPQRGQVAASAAPIVVPAAPDDWAAASPADDLDDITVADWVSPLAPTPPAPVGRTGPSGTGPAALATTDPPTIPDQPAAGQSPRVGTPLLPAAEVAQAASDGPPLDATGELPVRRGRRRGRWLALVAVICLGGLLAFLFGPLQRVSVPDVLNKSTKEATAILAAANLKLEADRQDYSETVQKGQIISTDPTAGQSVRTGSTVAALVSRGPERYDVPKLAGLTRAQAEVAVEAVKLKLGAVSEVFHDDVKKGRVVGSSPAAGTSVKPGTTVDIDLSKGPMPVELPKLEGTDAKAAAAKLKELGLKVDITRELSESVAKGNVIRMDPKGGQVVPHGSTVKIVQSKGPPMVTVPNVVGKSAAAAKAALEAVGFTVRVQYPLLVGVLDKVQKQNPAAGTSAPKGSTVSIDVV